MVIIRLLEQSQVIQVRGDPANAGNCVNGGSANQTTDFWQKKRFVQDWVQFFEQKVTIVAGI